MIPILSFDSQKVKIITSENIVLKETTKVELSQHIEANLFLNSEKLSLSSGFKIRSVPVLGYSYGKMITYYCKGDNLEIILRSHLYGEKRKYYLKLLRECILLFIRSGFGWGDIAPRNIIINKEAKTVWILDFEKPQSLHKYENINSLWWSRWIRSYALEELSCLLNPYEVNYVLNGLILPEWTDEIFSLDTIRSSRKKILLQSLFTETSIFTMYQLEKVEKIMASVATPFINKSGIIIYPMYYIENMINKYGKDWYVNFIINSG